MDAPNNSQTIINWLAGALGAVLTGFGVLYRGKVDTMEREKVKYVTHEDLEKHLNKLAEGRKELTNTLAIEHRDNTRRLERIEDSVNNGLERIHDRIDQFSVRLPGERTRSTDR